MPQPTQPQLRQAQGLTGDILGELRHNLGGVLQQALDPVRQVMLGAGGNAVMSGMDLLTALTRGVAVPLEQRNPGNQSLTPQHQRQRGNLLGNILAGVVPLGGAEAGVTKAAEEAVPTASEVVVNAKPKMEQFQEDLRAGIDAAHEAEMNHPYMQTYRDRDKWAGDWVRERSFGLVGEEGLKTHQQLWDDVLQHPEYEKFNRQAESLKPTDQELMERHRPLAEAVQKHLPKGWTARREVREDWPGLKETKIRVVDDQGRTILGDVRGIPPDLWEPIINQGKAPPSPAEVVRNMMREDGLEPANDTRFDELHQTLEELLKAQPTGEVKTFPGTIGQ